MIFSAFDDLGSHGGPARGPVSRPRRNNFPRTIDPKVWIFAFFLIEYTRIKK